MVSMLPYEEEENGKSYVMCARESFYPYSFARQACVDNSVLGAKRKIFSSTHFNLDIVLVSMEQTNSLLPTGVVFSCVMKSFADSKLFNNTSLIGLFHAVFPPVYVEPLSPSSAGDPRIRTCQLLRTQTEANGDKDSP